MTIPRTDVTDAVTRAQRTLRSGALTTEHHTRVAVINPILTCLGWDVTDPGQWISEYPVEGVGRVDDALLERNGHPKVFVEAKRPGNLCAKGQAQLFSYAAHKGVPLVVLTDGDTWDLYLSMASGEVPDRRFAQLVLTGTDTPEEIAEDLIRFLSREEVLSSGDRANVAAQSRLQANRDRSRSREALEPAWQRMLSDDMLSEWLREAAAEIAGTKPHADDVSEFLKQRSAPVTNAGPQQTGKPRPKPAKPVGVVDKPSKKKAAPTHITAVHFLGSRHPVSSSREALVTAAALIEGRAPGTLAKVSETADGKHMPVVAATAPEGKSQYYWSVGDTGWLVMGHGSTPNLQRKIQRLAEAAGLRVPEDVSVSI